MGFKISFLYICTVGKTGLFLQLKVLILRWLLAERFRYSCVN